MAAPRITMVVTSSSRSSSFDESGEGWFNYFCTLDSLRTGVNVGFLARTVETMHERKERGLKRHHDE